MIYVQQQSSRGDLQERRSASKKQTHMSKLRRSRSQQNCFDILLKSHQRTDAPPRIRSTRRTPLSRRTPLGDNFCRSKEFNE